MAVSHKAALSLLISVFLFAGFMALAYTGFFDLLESRFYSPSITRSLAQEIAGDTQTIEEFFTELESRFSATLDDDAVRRSFLPNQVDEDIFERSRLYGLLVETLNGVQWVRFVDAGGRRIHYSTLSSDILRQERSFIAYRNYDVSPGALPFEKLAVLEEGRPKFTMDEAGNRIIFSLPFYDFQKVYRGTALFSLSIQALEEWLITEGRLKTGEAVSLVDAPAGIITRLPRLGQDALIPLIASLWEQKTQGPAALDLLDTAASLALISSQTAQGIFIGRLVSESILSFPMTVRIILLGSLFFTIYLIIFLLFNLRQDTLTVIRTRIHNLRSHLLEEYERRKEETDWNWWSRELDYRREDIRAKIKRDIHKKGKQEKHINALIDSSWNETVAIIKARTGAVTGSLSRFDEAKIRDVVNQILRNSGQGAFPPTVSQPSPVTPAPENLETEEEVETVEMIQDIDEAEVVEELEDTEALEVIDEVEVVEELEDIEALEVIDEAEVVEELEDIEALEVIDELETGEEAINIEDTGTMGVETVGDDGEDVEELEELEGETGQTTPDRSQAVNEIARQIEFSPIVETEVAGEALEELEIVSPFVSMLSELADSGETAQENGPFSSALEIDTNYQLSLVHKPFTPETAGMPVPSEQSSGDPIIEFRDGVNYVKPNIIHAGTEAEKTLDPEIKNLVSSVLNK